MIDETIYKSTTEVNRRANTNIPFNKLEPGLSVFLHFNECREDSLRSLISNQNSKTETKKFKLIKHKEKEYYEVACVLKVDAEAVKEEYKIVESSPEAKTITVIPGKVKYPFNDVPEGMSFILPIKGTNETSLKVQCCNHNKKSERKFVLLKHEKYGMFEVYCVPKKKLEFFQPSAEMQEKVRQVNESC